ncbi:MAG: rRNA pseudouridine synthase [Clostridiales bacterium]|nr:rRNA pseudouridine synthase [Clostridiales bacterium]
MERLQKILSARGVLSRRAAERYIQAGRVTVNGVPATLGQQADPERDIIAVDGAELPRQAEPVYLLLNKPRGYVTTLSDEQGRSTVAQLVADCGQRVYPVGRLDLNSEGLLLLTNDGELTQRLTHPSHQVEKEYLVRVTGDVEAALPRLRRDMTVEGVAYRGGGGARALLRGKMLRSALLHHSSGKEPPGAENVRRLRTHRPPAPPGAGRPPPPGRFEERMLALSHNRGNSAAESPVKTAKMQEAKKILQKQLAIPAAKGYSISNKIKQSIHPTKEEQVLWRTTFWPPSRKTCPISPRGKS